MDFYANSKAAYVKEDVRPYVRSGSVHNSINISDYVVQDQIQTGNAPVYSIDYNREGIVAAGSGSADVTIWNPETGQARTLHGIIPNVPVTAVCYSPDGYRLSVGVGDPGGNGWLTIWDWRTGQLLEEFRRDSAIIAIAYSPNGQFVAVGTEQGEVAIYSDLIKLISVTYLLEQEV